ncbi:hypothetical protein Bbelb_192750 [Branchiostoma belcheri]|nr:hypothetical protein Bbelb_192750 [Branchiostoma belcheri]
MGSTRVLRDGFAGEKLSPHFGTLTTSPPANFIGGKTVPPRQNSRPPHKSAKEATPRQSENQSFQFRGGSCHIWINFIPFCRTEKLRSDQCVGEVITIMEAYPEVYTTAPVQPKEKKPGQLTNEQVKQYFSEGFVIVNDFFTPEELQPCRDGTAELVDALAERLYKAGKIKKFLVQSRFLFTLASLTISLFRETRKNNAANRTDTYRDAGLFRRLTLIEEEFPGTCALLLKEGKIHKAYCDLWVNDRLLNVMEQLVGPEIAGNPLWNLRPKVPSNDETTVPWHQDNCYTLPESLGTLIPVAWIPLLDATVENGCMQVVRGGHRRGVTADHVGVVGGTWYVEVLEEEMEKTQGVNIKTDVVTCEVPYGGVLFINNAIPHRSLPNKTDNIRWSLDLRWQHPDKPSGFWGKRKPVLMRTARDPMYAVPQGEWDKFFNADRGSELESSTGLSGKDVDEFDTTVHGPWLTRWPIVRHNRHTRALQVQQDGMACFCCQEPRGADTMPRQQQNPTGTAPMQQSQAESETDDATTANPAYGCRAAPNGGTAHSRHENRLQNNNKGCAAKFKVAHAPANILDHLSAKWRCTNPSHSKVYPYLTARQWSRLVRKPPLVTRK